MQNLIHPLWTETISKLTVCSQLLQNYFSHAKKYLICMQMFKVRAGCPNLGHTSLLI